MTPPIHVLHVDDDAALRDLTAEFLERVDSDITVHSVADPTAVPARLEDDPIDCVVSDYEMPQQNGLDLCWEVRAGRPDLPFFLFTSRGGEDLVGRAMIAGATDYVQKEPGLGQYALLANRITNAVARHRIEKRLARLKRAVDGNPEAPVASGTTVDVGTVRTTENGAEPDVEPVGSVEH